MVDNPSTNLGIQNLNPFGQLAGITISTQLKNYCIYYQTQYQNCIVTP